MKGIIFLKLEEFVEATFDEYAWDAVLTEVELASGGAYTSGLLYDDDEFFTIFVELCKQKALDPIEAQRLFGRWIFAQLMAISPHDMTGYTDVFGFLRAVQDVIHVEVQKIYIDALLPTFEFIEETDTTLRMRYVSPRKLHYFCEGLILSLAEHLQQPVEITLTESTQEKDDSCLFEIVKL
ncbi:heme NO-binding domain-containing protein [Alteromonas sp. ASW11-36]|uniref:Heme NO-binding domain-containing protein n=1 Tax=Alteromonas arenosi TaxID=3055817 RepID=A0ABT7SSX7_9ALTE|nr:heme NO-binding domain-containing protein [Alteromonas sp. ASW11-36]MDM7859301.1 heme NO-binding domain-containing protein [Alteromonas sp. ASW11-36]